MNTLTTIPPQTPIVAQLVDDGDPRNLTLREFYQQFYLPLKLRAASARTKVLYQGLFNNMLRFHRHEVTLAELTDDLVARQMAWHLDRGNAPNTANRESIMICAIWRYACRRGVLRVWPETQLEKVPERIPRGWTVDELRRLFKAIDETKGMIGRIPANLWWRALHLVIWDTGERISAVMATRWDWLTLTEPRRLTIPAEHRKGGRTDRTYPLHDATVDALRRIAAPARQKVFEWPYGTTYLWKRYAPIIRRAGLPDGPQYRFHALRKTVASYSKKAGLDPMVVLDHRDGRVTRKYLDPRICGGASLPETLFRPDAE